MAVSVSSINEINSINTSNKRSSANGTIAKNNPEALHQQNIVGPAEYLRAAALNDLYTLRKFYDYEVRYSWGAAPATFKQKPVYGEVHHSNIREEDVNGIAKSHQIRPCDYRTERGETAMMLAAAYGNLKALAFIKERSHPDMLHMVDEDGFNVVHHAVMSGDLNTFRYTIQKGCDWKVKANSTPRGRGETPFMVAVRCHRKKLVEYFLKKFKIDFQDTNADGKNVHGIAQEINRPGMTCLMRKKTGEERSPLEIEYIAKLKEERKGVAAEKEE